MTEEFKKGDIVQNRFIPEGNPNCFMIYMGNCIAEACGVEREEYACANYLGEMIGIVPDGNILTKVGHMDEYDAFMAALKGLKDRRDDDASDNS